MLQKILKLSQPISLFVASLTYSLGAGMAHYLGADIRWPVFWLALLAELALLFSAFLFTGYFNPSLGALAPDETPQRREQGRVRVLQAAYAALTFSGAIIATLIFVGALDLSTGILLGLSLVFLLAYGIPPLHLSRKGYGEIVMSIFLAGLLPALAFLFQTSKFHRLVPLIGFPLFLLALACLLVGNFPTFATDQKFHQRSLLIRLGWQRAVPIHHGLILASYFLFAAAPFLGVTWGLIWPVFLALPFAALQIFLLQRISQGGRPLWNFLIALSIATFGLTVYVLAFTFWTR